MNELGSLLLFAVGFVSGGMLLWSWRIDACHQNERLLRQNAAYRKKLYAAGERIVDLEAALERKKYDDTGLY